MKKIVLLMVASIAFLTSCESRTYEDISLAVSNPTYVANVKPVIDANCTGCHNGGTFPSLTNYTEVKDATQNGRLLCRIDGSCGSIMPPSGQMPSGTISMINLWAKQGYKEQ